MSDLNQFRSKGPELLVELAQHTSETVREIIDIEPAVADQIGQAVANRMMQVWGGQNVYFPMGMVWMVNPMPIRGKRSNICNQAGASSVFFGPV